MKIATPGGKARCEMVAIDMEMPVSCERCRAIGNYDIPYYYCWLINKRLPDEVVEKRRADICPLVEIPSPHGRLIDADKLLRDNGLDTATKYGNTDKEQMRHSYETMYLYEVAEMIEGTPEVLGAES